MKTFADLLPILNSSFSCMSDENGKEYQSFSVKGNFIIFSSHIMCNGYKEYNGELEFSLNSAIDINGNIVKGNPFCNDAMVMTFYNKIPLIFE